MAHRIGDELKASALWFTAPRTAALRAETVGPPGPEEVRVETIASRSSMHDWTIRVHRHRNLFQILSIEGGGNYTHDYDLRSLMCR